MLKWLDRSSNTISQWDLVWDYGDHRHAIILGKIFNAKDSASGNTIGKWCLEANGAFATLTSKKLSDAQHELLCEVVQMSSEMSREAADMVLSLARSTDNGS